mgnify:CR=1 FL=1
MVFLALLSLSQPVAAKQPGKVKLYTVVALNQPFAKAVRQIEKVTNYSQRTVDGHRQRSEKTDCHHRGAADQGKKLAIRNRQ